jgi:Ca-activated chloride channel family protein
VLLTVVDRHGRLITNLKRDDFEVFEDNQPQSITNFSAETDLPLNIALVIDTSGSIRDKLRFEQEAAAEFFYSVLRPRHDRALIMTFDTTVRLRTDFTDDPNLLSATIRQLISGGSTSLYDAVARAATEKLAGQPGRRVIIIVSDGMDNSSHISLEQTIEAAQKNDVIIYAISTNRLQEPPLPEQQLGDANLKRLSAETGGHVLNPKKAQDLSRAFHRISEELRAQYSLAYKPTNSERDGTYRQIRVVVSNKVYLVRARQGYFAPGL